MFESTRSGNGQAPEVAVTRQQCTNLQKRELLIYMMTSYRVYLAALQARVTEDTWYPTPGNPEDFMDDYYGAAWAVYSYLAQAFPARRPEEREFWVELDRLARSRHTLPDAVNKLCADGVIAKAFSTPADSGNSAYGIQLLQNFCVDRNISRSIIDSANQVRGCSWVNPSDFAKQIEQRISAISTIGGTVGKNAIVSNWKPAKDDRRIPTGLPWYDAAMGGGAVPGEVYGLVGPFGSFKTGGLIQMAVAQAKILAAMPGGGLVAFATYEQSLDELMARIQAHAAGIPQKRLELFRAGEIKLSTMADRAPYERELQIVDCEVDRLARAEELGTRIQFVDMSGTGENRHAGRGYVPELAGSLLQTQAEASMPIRCVIVDYAKIMARKYVYARGIKVEHLRHYIGGLPNELKREIADPLGAWVWCAQQLNAVANRKGYGQEQSHVDSSEAADFGENMYFCAAHSRLDPVTFCLNWNPSKIRKGEPRPSMVLRVSRYTSALQPTEDFVYSPTARRIIDAESAEAFGEAPVRRQADLAPGPTAGIAPPD